MASGWLMWAAGVVEAVVGTGTDEVGSGTVVTVVEVLGTGVEVLGVDVVVDGPFALGALTPHPASAAATARVTSPGTTRLLTVRPWAQPGTDGTQKLA